MLLIYFRIPVNHIQVKLYAQPRSIRNIEMSMVKRQQAWSNRIVMGIHQIVASIIGRRLRASWLLELAPAFGQSRSGPCCGSGQGYSLAGALKAPRDPTA